MNFRDHFTHHNPALSLPAGISGCKKGEIKIISSFYPKSNPAESFPPFICYKTDSDVSDKKLIMFSKFTNDSWLAKRTSEDRLQEFTWVSH